MFNEIVSDFIAVSAAEAAEGLQTDGYILFIGRGSCPFCNLFAPKLADVARANQYTIHFLDSSDYSDSAISDLRARYHVPTVPGLLVNHQGQVEVVCESSLAPEAIEAFIEA